MKEGEGRKRGGGQKARTDLPVKHVTHRFNKKTTAKHPRPTKNVYMKYRALFRASLVSCLSSALTLTAPPIVLSSAVALPGTCVGGAVAALLAPLELPVAAVGFSVGDEAFPEFSLLPPAAADFGVDVGHVVGVGDFVTSSSGTEGATNLLVG